MTSVGLTAIANIGYDNLYPTLWAQWLPYVSGLNQEFYAYWGDNSLIGPPAWTAYLEPEVQACVSQSKVCNFNVGGSTLTTAQIDYSTASLLMYTDGNQYISYGDGNSNQDPIFTLGAALGPATQSGGIYTRQFANGSVSVNPSAGTGTITTT
jgi:hypothetical protein